MPRFSFVPLLALFAALIAWAAPQAARAQAPSRATVVDRDKDGTPAEQDCNDNNAAIRPGARELCDGRDNDCDGSVDEDDASNARTWYADQDGDATGDPSATKRACTAPDGHVATATDCDDSAATINPKATEICDGKDNDCDGRADENDAYDAKTWYADKDRDEFGNRLAPTRACNQPTGFVADATDCNDVASNAHPGGTEICDGVDNDCNGKANEPEATDARTWYADRDGDRFGDPASSRKSCTQPAGYVADSTDCADASGTTRPSAAEICDGKDNNCDGSIDEDSATNAKTWYSDSDSDGFGAPASPKRSCTQPAGFVAASGDCDDSAGAINGKATEVCDGKDNDCDGKTDEPDATDSKTWYADKDGDEHGAKLVSTRACEQPRGFVADSTDCNDAAASAHPGAAEVCDGRDNDCNGKADEPEATDARTWYADRDLDRFGNANTSRKSCTQPAGYVADSTDCDDAAGTVRPNAAEICDGKDNNCDGSTDEDSATNAKTWYADGDSDGFGSPGSPRKACTQPSGFGPSAGDCDDGAAAVNPKAPESCDGKDNDCDGKTDEPDAADARTWYTDRDGDQYGAKLASTRACEQPSGFVADSTDCNDTAAAAHPGAAEVCDGRDNDCNGKTDEPEATDARTWYADKDLDRFGNASSSRPACSQPAGFVADNTDCDDAAGTVRPNATELCNGRDDDCDGSSDEDDAANAKTWYADTDGDSFGDRSALRRACTQPGGHVANLTDCDDRTSSISPSATETCDSKDNDCDGRTDEPDASDAPTWYADADADLFGDKISSTRACSQPRGYVSDNTDCNARASTTFPGAPERCDGADNDCDGVRDEDDAVDAKTWYADTDGDRFGDERNVHKACSLPKGFVADRRDCDDSSNQAFPGGREICDGLDNNCDGTTDEDSAIGAPIWYADTDGDDFGDLATTHVSCAAPSGFVKDRTDCDDKSPATYPGAAEFCDGVDNNCNPGDEGGRVTFSPSSGGRQDVTAAYAAGRPEAPALQSLNNAGTLTFCDGTYYVNLALRVPGVVLKGLNGRNSTLLDGGGQGTVVTVHGDAQIADLTLTHGRSGDSGGGLVVLGGKLGITDARIAGNEATSFGGGLYAQRSTVTLTRTEIAGNKAHSGGGAYAYYATITTTDGVVANNQAVDGAGLYARFSTVGLVNTAVTGNVASSQGGGVQLYGGADLSCRGGEGAGVFGNTALRGASIHVAENSRTSSAGCSFAAPDGSKGEIFLDGLGPFAYGDGATFLCGQQDGCK